MKGVILLNGEPYRGDIDDSCALVFSCDGAYAWAKGKLRIDKNIGDFDSLSETPYPAPEEIYPAEKNFTDGEIALFKMLAAGVDFIEFYGFGGGREDHFLGNLQLLYKAYKSGVRCAAFTNVSVIFPADGKINLGKFYKKTISVLPFGESVNIMGSRGLKYTYPEKLSLGECRGISNIVTGREAVLETEGVALVIVNTAPV